MSYEPRPDSIAFRALAHMELLHKGSEIPSGTLATALGIEKTSLFACLEAAVKARAIFRRQKGGHSRSPVFWSLVDHSTKEVTKVQPPAAVSPIRLNAPRHEASSEAAQLEGKEVGEGHADRRPPADGLDIDQVHRTRDNLIEMEPVAALAPTCDHGSTDHRCKQCAADIRAGVGEILVGGAAPAVDAHEHFARTTIDEAKLLPTGKLELHTPAIALVTLSIQCTPHQAERVSAFLASMTEVA